MSDLGPKPAYFWDETTQTFRKAVVGEPGEYVWNTTTNSWEFGTVGAEYVYNHTTKSWEFGPGGQYVRNTSTNSWDKVTSPGYGGPYYWDTSTNSWLKNAASVDVAEAYARWDFINNQAWFGGDYVGALSSTPGWSFTRASTGYAQTSAGVLVPFASGELRRTDKGVLIEGARTNLCLQSQDFSTTWTNTASTESANATTAPDGTLTADKLIEDGTAASTHRLFQTVTTTAAAYTFSVYAKAGERSWVYLRLNNSVPESCYAWFNLATGVVGSVSGTGATSSIESIGNGWYRCSLKIATANNAANTHVIGLTTADTVADYNGDGASGLYLWGAQAELGAFPSSYIPTTTASATRAADSLSITGVTGLDSAPISTFAEIELVGAAADERGIISVDNGATATNIAQYLYVDFASLLKGIVVSGGATQWNAGTAAIATDVTVKVAGRSATNDFNAASGGALTGSDVSGSLSASTTQIRLGNRYWNGAKPIFGYLRRAAIWNRALSDAELQAVTL